MKFSDWDPTQGSLGEEGWWAPRGVHRMCPILLRPHLPRTSSLSTSPISKCSVHEVWEIPCLLSNRKYIFMGYFQFCISSGIMFLVIYKSMWWIYAHSGLNCYQLLALFLETAGQNHSPGRGFIPHLWLKVWF